MIDYNREMLEYTMITLGFNLQQSMIFGCVCVASRPTLNQAILLIEQAKLVCKANDNHYMKIVAYGEIEE